MIKIIMGFFVIAVWIETILIVIEIYSKLAEKKIKEIATDTETEQELQNKIIVGE